MKEGSKACEDESKNIIDASIITTISLVQLFFRHCSIVAANAQTKLTLSRQTFLLLRCAGTVDLQIHLISSYSLFNYGKLAESTTSGKPNQFLYGLPMLSQHNTIGRKRHPKGLYKADSEQRTAKYRVTSVLKSKITFTCITRDCTPRL